MEKQKAGPLNFKVGQLAEMRTFEHGFRGAWFRCKIKDIDFKKNKMWLQYYDFDSQELSWEKIYQVPPYLRKSKPIKRQLMLRPPYPEMYRKSEMPPVNKISQACVIIDGTWKVGDLVDWFESGCYWSARVTKVLRDDKVQVELPMPPSGEGKEGEEGKHEAFCKDLRPSLVWSETEGWTLPTMEGHTSCGAQLIFPTLQGKGMDLDLDLDLDLEPEPKPELEPEPEPALEPEPKPEPAEAGSTTRKSGEGDRYREQNEKSVKMDCDLMESSECISSLQRKVGADEVEVEKRKLNIMHEDTLEAAIIDLEELVAKVKWMQRLLQSPSNDATPSSWKFA